MVYRFFHSVARLVIAALILTGCGPLFTPMTSRLTPEDQRQIDAIWDNMLTPVNRLDRQTLLDTTIVGWLYQLGVDRLRLVSEKYLTHGKVVMEIDCDRASPDSDEFIVTVLDDRGQTLRRDRFTRKEVDESAQTFWGPGLPLSQSNSGRFLHPTSAPMTEPETAPTTEPSETPEEKRLAAERDRRMKAVEAATRPARVR